MILKLVIQRGATKEQIETGLDFLPQFDQAGLIPAIAVHAETQSVIMLAWMNEEALALSLNTGEAHYWSRSRKSIWRKGETSGQIQKIIAIDVDCDQDTLLLHIVPGGDGGCCHLGHKSCFHRRIYAENPHKLKLIIQDEKS